MRDALTRRLRASASARDLRLLVEASLTVIVTWLLLGWFFDRPITQADGSWLVVPYTDSALAAGGDWTQHLYRFGVLGGSEMHAFGGMLPLVQLAAKLGLSTTATVNLVTCFVGVAYGYFGVRLAESLASVWRGEPVVASPPERVVAIWLIAFAPLLGNRLAVGHENLLLGFLPYIAIVSLIWQARAGTISKLALAFAVFAIANGVSGLGAQSLVYSAVFGIPLLVVSLTGLRDRRAIAEIALVAVAGVACVLPRLVPMVAHAVGPDATRGLAASVKTSYGAAPLADWVTSIPWTIGARAAGTVHEHNYPVGPLALLAIGLWPRGSRRLAIALCVTLAIVILYACDLPPGSLLAGLPGLGAFRGPSRAAMAVLLVVPALAVAVVWTRHHAAAEKRRDARLWLGVALGCVLVLGLRGVAPWVREVVAWASAVTLVALGVPSLARRIPRELVAATLAVLAAFGVLAFDERFPRGIPENTVEDRPRLVREAVAPELTSALDRVVLPDAPAPFEMSAAFAARLPSIDGVWYPPPRVLALLSALGGKPLPPTTSVFRSSLGRTFPVLQALYNVRFALRGLATQAPTLEPLPTPPGPAWFPAELAVIERADDMASALTGKPLAPTLAHTAWVLASELPTGAPRSCRQASVGRVTTDALGQTATFEVSAPAACVLVVAANYATTLAARSGGQALTVFPVDIALTGIVVPAGTTRIVLGPRVPSSTGAMVVAWLAVILVIAMLALRRRAAASISVVVACFALSLTVTSLLALWLGVRDSRAEGFPGRVAGMPATPDHAAPHDDAGVPGDAMVTTGPNVLVILVDTVRADRLGVAGYRRDGASLTPNLDRFAATATRFTRAYAHAANTPKSFPTIMTSRLPSQITFHKAFHNFPGVIDENVMLFEVLAAAGLHTASFSSHFYFEPRRNVGQGVAEYDNAGALDLGAANADYAAPRIVPKVVARLESLAAERRRFAMFVHLFEPHSTYIDHPEHPVTARGEPGLVARYDYEIAIDDAWIGKILDTLDRTKLSERTVVVVLSDHGESFGLHAFEGKRAFFHGQTLYDEVLRVPLLVRVPGVDASVRDEVVGLVDVAPTIVDALALPAQPTFLGRSLMPLARGQPLEPRDVRAEILPTPDLDDTITALVAGDGSEKIITSAKRAKAEVYDLRSDPDEKQNLAPHDDARARRLRARLDAPR